MTPMGICLLLMSLEAIEQMHNPTRKLPIRVRKETRDLVLSLWPESPRKLAPRSIATSERSIGLCIPRKTQKIIISMRKTDSKKANFCTTNRLRNRAP
jgi:hypothetical protein